MKDTSLVSKKNNKPKDEMELVAKFKSYEKQLFDLLKLEPIEFDEKTNKTTVKKNIKKYIQKVEQAKIILNEYEKIAHELGECVSEASKDSEAYSKAVIKLRKEPKIKKQELVEKYNETTKVDDLQEENLTNKEKLEDEVILVDGKNAIIKKKKSKGNLKQF